MKRMFLFLVLAAVILAVGLYRNWFQFSSQSDDHKASIKVSVDKAKVQEDADQAANKLQNLAQQAKDKSPAATQKTQNGNGE